MPIDCIGDTDGTGGYLVHGNLKKKNRVLDKRAPDLLLYYCFISQRYINWSAIMYSPNEDGFAKLVSKLLE